MTAHKLIRAVMAFVNNQASERPKAQWIREAVETAYDKVGIPTSFTVFATAALIAYVRQTIKL